MKIKDLLFFKKPIFFLLLTIAFFVIGAQMEIVGKVIFFLLGCLCFNHFYMVFEVYMAIFAYRNNVKHQVGFTLRNNVKNIVLHIMVIFIAILLMALFFDEARSNILWLLAFPIMCLFALLSMHSIDKRLQEGFDKYFEEKENKEKISEESLD